jgi:hypothetical protein
LGVAFALCWSFPMPELLVGFLALENGPECRSYCCSDCGNFLKWERQQNVLPPVQSNRNTSGSNAANWGNGFSTGLLHFVSMVSNYHVEVVRVKNLCITLHTIRTCLSSITHRSLSNRGSRVLRLDAAVLSLFRLPEASCDDPGLPQNPPKGWQNGVVSPAEVGLSDSLSRGNHGRAKLVVGVQEVGGGRHRPLSEAGASRGG